MNTKHVYDTDIIESINRLKELTSENNIKVTTSGLDIKEYFERLDEAVAYYCEFNKIKFNKTEASFLVVPSNNNFYNYALAIDLLGRPIHEIGSILDEHRRNFQGNEYALKNNFIGLIKYLVIRIIKSSCPFSNENLLTRIMEWTREQENLAEILNIISADQETFNKYFAEYLLRFPKSIFTSSQSSNQEINHTDTLKYKDENIEDSLGSIVLTILDPEIQKLLFNDLKNRFNPGDQNILKDLIEGKDIFERKIVFRGDAKYFIHVFNRIARKGLTQQSLTDLKTWITTHFQYKSKTNKPPTDFRDNYVYNTLKNPGNISKNKEIQLSFNT